MIGRPVKGAVNMVGSIEYSVQARGALFVSFEWLLPLTGLGAAESGVDYRVFGIVIIAAALVFVVSEPAVVILSFGTARLACTITATG
mgnify:CR=1 FL=1